MAAELWALEGYKLFFYLCKLLFQCDVLVFYCIYFMTGWSLKASLLAIFVGSFLKEKVLINPVLSISDHPQLTLQIHCIQKTSSGVKAGKDKVLKGQQDNFT